METKDNGTKAKGNDFGCCNPENFKEMFEKMSKCCPGKGDSPDFSTMMKKMMEMCCGPKTAVTKEKTESSENKN